MKKTNDDSESETNVGVLTRAQAKRMSMQHPDGGKQTKSSPAKTHSKNTKSSQAKTLPRQSIASGDMTTTDELIRPDAEELRNLEDCSSLKKKKKNVSEANELNATKRESTPKVSRHSLNGSLKDNSWPVEIDGIGVVEDEIHSLGPVKIQKVKDNVQHEQRDNLNKPISVPIIEKVKGVLDTDRKKEVEAKVPKPIHDNVTPIPEIPSVKISLPPKKMSKPSPIKETFLKKKAVIEDNSESDEDSDAECRKEIMRSAEKRIIRNISTSESESRNVGLNNHKVPVREDNTDSDSAPEDVAFDASRKSAMDLLKHTVDVIQRDKQRKKEKRKERLEMLRQQKEENLIRLKERKANREDASCSSSEESAHEKSSQFNSEGISWLSKGKKTYFEDAMVTKKQKLPLLKDNEITSVVTSGIKQKKSLKRLPSELLENLPDKFPKKLKMSQVSCERSIQKFEKKMKEKKTLDRDTDFIPLPSSSSTQFGVVALNTPKLKTVAQNAADFRNSMLYGKRVERVPAKTVLNNNKKKKYQA